MLFDLGWFREQFCIIACPYGRFQSVLLDARSQVVSYDVKRGEPRKGIVPAGGPVGDCVNCYRCVQVCPTGIDIRRGVQLECVACTACMDACDDVMTRLHKPKGLIRYDTLIPGRGPKALRFRPMMYLTILVICASTLFLILRSRRSLEADIVRAAEAPYQSLPALPASNGVPKLVNHFKFDLKNQSFDDQTLAIVVPEALKARGVQIVVSNFNPLLAAGSSERSDVFIEFPKDLLAYGHGQVQLTVTSNRPDSDLPVEVKLVGPFN
jgi:cytochrome c oxidase accessory protein FixG